MPVPKPDRGRKLKTLSGDVHCPLSLPPGCNFQGRCPLVKNRCCRQEIDFYHTGDGHNVHCWKVVGR
ncbi:MAG: hypothetical protein J7J91_09115 [Deltaproteobacteria bacterium]|nr:hypothetical protein [Deltaproteobacteria bacterium]